MTFSIPVGGFAATPIVKSGSSNGVFAERKAGVTHGLRFRVERDSPFFAQDQVRTMEQQLLDWTYEGSARTVDTDGVAFATSGKADLAFTPADSATKSGVVASLRVIVPTVIMIR